ncbi:MAG: hypothetical protein HYX68_22365 [Planctomycetes bacterium]|nr:hypothetical protein [Planctomycetota bacterium]
MLFMEPSETPYDLRFRLLGVPVRVHPMFWLVSGLMGLSALRMGFQFLAIWIVCVFVSILIHELGHVAMGQIFGERGHIVLYGFGGLAIGSNTQRLRWQRMAVSFAGPLAGFLLLGFIYAVLWAWDRDSFHYYTWVALLDLGFPENILEGLEFLQPRPMHRLIAFAIHNLIFINLLWGLINLLPVWPLDGGMMCREACESALPDRGLSLSLGISLLVASLLAAHCLLVVLGRRLLPLEFGSGYSAILFGILAIQSFQLLQQAQSRRPWGDDSWDERGY